MYNIFMIALVFVFVYFFFIVNKKYNSSVKSCGAKEDAERELAASFIRNAIKQYELRHTRPDLQLVSEFERLTDEQDELVERYFNYLEELEANQVNESVVPITIKASR
ncbi:hypothetical protein [Shewanella sp. MM_2022_3]|uniref:hypothetical protein n=1 Tax=Shewanella sp. MM_2022_3 TaxID=2923280 RepID=UPI001F4C0155|nr:hypothetical protein [Shewanella sp. MM_2022_3]MCH7421278.1 hypothetical protein [Shewanella sp. MM_2022_3]